MWTEPVCGARVTGSVFAPGSALPAWGQPDWLPLEGEPLRLGGLGDSSEGTQQEVALAPGKAACAYLQGGLILGQGEEESLARELPEAAPLRAHPRGGE